MYAKDYDNNIQICLSYLYTQSNVVVFFLG